MNSFLAKFLTIGVIAALPLSLSAYNGKNVNAKAVSIQWIMSGWEDPNPACGANNFFDDGSILVYTIQNAKVVRKDTVYNKTQGLATATAFDLTGKRIAFMRENQGPSATGACVVTNGGKNTVSIINTDGTGLTNVCDLPYRPAPGENMVLDWPAGEWIYYDLPRSNGEKSLDIWKVNATTKQNVEVCNYAPGDASPCGFRRFTLDVTATHMAAQIMDCSFGANSIFDFPGGCSHSAICGVPACNIAISPSGKIVGAYMGGNHTELYLNNGVGAANPACSGTGLRAPVSIFNDLDVWAGEVIGVGAEHINWAVNSDKWVLQEIGMSGSGHASELSLGSNQVVANWVDQVAINISKNPPTPSTSYARLNNNTGDFWVDDPVNNPQKNKYEDLQGVWHEVPGATAIAPETVRENPAGEALFSMLSNREIALRLTLGTPTTVLIVNLHGATVCRTIAHGPARISLRSLPAGAYRLVTTSLGARHQSGFVLR
jgi:hypothetical protein